MTRKTFWITTIIVALWGLSVPETIGRQQQGQTQRRLSSAAWKERFSTPEEMVKGVDKVVLAEAVYKQPGRIAYSDNGEDSLPFEIVGFRVLKGLKASVEGEMVYVERAGGTDHKGDVVRFDVDGGDFEMGSSYLLFLKQQEGGPYYYQVNDQGRYQVVNERLMAVEKTDSVAIFFQDKSVEEGLRFVREGKGRESSYGKDSLEKALEGAIDSQQILAQITNLDPEARDKALRDPAIRYKSFYFLVKGRLPSQDLVDRREKLSVTQEQLDKANQVIQQFMETVPDLRDNPDLRSEILKAWDEFQQSVVTRRKFK